MNSRLFLSAFAVAAATLGAASSFAYGSNDLGEDAFPAARPSQSVQSRAAVRDQTAHGQAFVPAISENPDGASNPAMAAFQSGRTRAQVSAEGRRAMQNHSAAVTLQEDRVGA